MKFSKPLRPSFKWKTGTKGWVYSSSEDFPNASGVYFEVTGHQGKIKTTISDRIYFVVAGEGEFLIDGISVKVSEHYMVIVHIITPYDYKASYSIILKLFLVHIPAFDRDAEVQLEKIEK